MLPKTSRPLYQKSLSKPIEYENGLQHVHDKPFQEMYNGQHTTQSSAILKYEQMFSLVLDY